MNEQSRKYLMESGLNPDLVNGFIQNELSPELRAELMAIVCQLAAEHQMKLREKRELN